MLPSTVSIRMVDATIVSNTHFRIILFTLLKSNLINKNLSHNFVILLQLQIQKPTHLHFSSTICTHYAQSTYINFHLITPH